MGMDNIIPVVHTHFSREAANFKDFDTFYRNFT